MAELPRYVKPQTVERVITITADRRLANLEADATVIFNSASSLIATLPPAKHGQKFTFIVKAVPGSGVGALIKVSGQAKIFSKVSATGATVTEAVTKGLVNTQATAVKGDFIEVISDGTDWFVRGIAGTWAREA